MRTGVPEYFWESLAKAQQRVLMLDYDGTLAPFVVKRDEAVPYPGVRESLAELLAAGHTRVVIISGRAAANVARLVEAVGRASPPAADRRPQRVALPEIWGSHGLERRGVDGSYSVRELPAGVQAALDAGVELARHHIDAERLELKPGCVALHVRGLERDEASALLTTVETGWEELIGSAELRGGRMTDVGVRRNSSGDVPLPEGTTGPETRPILLLKPFDGGLELRYGGTHKGVAVNEVLAEAGSNTVAAYLGDDLTDEDAFRALSGRGLGILVRSESRESLAEAWFQPPEGLLEFLRHWHVVASGQQQK